MWQLCLSCQQTVKAERIAAAATGERVTIKRDILFRSQAFYRTCFACWLETHPTPVKPMINPRAWKKKSSDAKPYLPGDGLPSWKQRRTHTSYGR